MTTLRHRRGQLPPPALCFPPPKPPLPPGFPAIDCHIRPVPNPLDINATADVRLYCHRLYYSGSPVITLSCQGAGGVFIVPPTMTDGELAHATYVAWDVPGHYLLTATFTYPDGASRSASALVSIVAP